MKTRIAEIISNYPSLSGLRPQNQVGLVAELEQAFSESLADCTAAARAERREADALAAVNERLKGELSGTHERWIEDRADFKDELASLTAENEQLRGELAAAKVKADRWDAEGWQDLDAIRGQLSKPTPQSTIDAMGFDPFNLPPSTSNIRKTLENVHKQVESAIGRAANALERGSISRAECQIWAYVLRRAAEALDKLAEELKCEAQ